jgi:hypothetical protein
MTVAVAQVVVLVVLVAVVVVVIWRKKLIKVVVKRRIQLEAARIVTSTAKLYEITKLYQELQWQKNSVNVENITD